MEPGMLNENQNKPGWKSRLEDTVDLGGETCRDKNELWEKLDSRLHGKPRRKRFGWYWAAAACLLLALLFTFINVNRIPTDTAKTASQKIQLKTDFFSEITALIKNKNIENTTVIIEKKPQENKSALQEKQKAFSNNITTREVRVKKPDVVADEVRTALVAVPLSATSTTPVLVATTKSVLKQKLKVVHNNELGDNIEDSHANEHIAEHHTIRIEFMSQEIYTSTTPSQTVSGLAIFKTKTSPSN